MTSRFLAPLLFLLLALPAARAADPAVTLRQEFEAATSRNRKADIARRLAASYQQQGLFDEAITVCQYSLAQEPSKKFAYPLLIAQGDAQLALKRYAQAIESFRDAIGLFPKRTDAHFHLAATYEQSELAELARLEYAEILKYDPASGAAHARMAALYAEQGLTTRALEHFRAALSGAATPDLCRQMAVCAATAGDSELAIVMLNRMGEEHTGYQDYLMLGRLYELMNKGAEAERSYRAAMSLDPDAIESKLSLSLLYLNNSRLDEARQLLQESLRQHAGEAALHFVLSAVYQRQGRFADALREAQSAREKAQSGLLQDYAQRYQSYLANGEAVKR